MRDIYIYMGRGNKHYSKEKERSRQDVRNFNNKYRTSVCLSGNDYLKYKSFDYLEDFIKPFDKSIDYLHKSNRNCRKIDEKVLRWKEFIDYSRFLIQNVNQDDFRSIL